MNVPEKYPRMALFAVMIGIMEVQWGERNTIAAITVMEIVVGITALT